MNTFIILAFAATCGTWFATALGAATVLFFKNTHERLLNAMLGFAAGVMIAASFWSLLQPAIEQCEISGTPAWLVASFGFVSGALFIWLSDKAVTAAQIRASEKSGQTQSAKIKRILMLVFAITLHNIPEGLAVGVAFGALHNGFTNEGLAAAISVAVGIGLQNFPEGAAVSIPLRREGYSLFRSFLWGQASALVEPIAGVLGAALVVYVSNLLPFALSFAAGAMILVAVHELIPECQKNRDESPYFSTLGIIFGFSIMMILDIALG